MLTLSQRATAPIHVEFLGGAHAGEQYDADYSFCPNPVCTCGYLELTLSRDATESGEARSPEFRFEVDILTQDLVSSGRGASEYDRNMAKAFIEQMTEADWQMLWGLYAGYKRKITQETPDTELKTRFPVAEIEESSFTVGFHEILPFGEDITLEMDGRSFLLDDQYCVRAQCGCTDCFITLIEEGRPGQDAREQDLPTLEIDYQSGRWRVAHQGGEAVTLLERVADRLVSGENRALLEGRHNRLRSLYLMYKRAHHQPKRPATDKVGRNDPCPCGSGKKYKKCCLPCR